MALPTQFRLFRVGQNTSTKGTVVFDAKSAKAIMAEYAKHGADMMLDLEHLSINRDSPNYKPDAMAWFKLGLRNGELWATDVRYSPEGAERLISKKQRYISPYFLVEKASKRVVSLINAALTALPATDAPMALVAASQTHGLMAFSITGNPMDLSALIELLGLPSDATLDDIVAAVKALQEGKTPAAGETPPAPVANSEGPPAAAPAGGEGAGLGGATATPRKTTVSIQHNQDASSAAVLELTRKVASLETVALNRTREELIRANADKLSPVLEAWARTQTIDTLTTFFAAAAPTGSTEEEPTREAVLHSQTGGKKTVAVALTAAEIDLCNKTGVSQEATLAYKQTLANSKGNG